MKRFVLSFLILAIAVAIAGTVPAAHHYNITLAQDTTVNGTRVIAGDYRLTVSPAKITLAGEKLNLDLPAKIETNNTKFDDTAVRFVDNKLAEIRIGGTKTRIVLVQ
jgi:hypothetical protein